MPKRSRTNPPGPGTKTIGVNMPIELANQLKKVADASNMSIGEYCREILSVFASTETILRRVPQVYRPDGTIKSLEQVVGESLGERVLGKAYDSDAGKHQRPQGPKPGR